MSLYQGVTREGYPRQRRKMQVYHGFSHKTITQVQQIKKHEKFKFSIPFLPGKDKNICIPTGLRWIMIQIQVCHGAENSFVRINLYDFLWKSHFNYTIILEIS